MDHWLRTFVERHIASQRRARQVDARVLAEAGGMRLFGTIGAEVFLRPDGSTVALVEGSGSEPPHWQVDTEDDRIAALVIARAHYPELARLLPDRPPTALDCSPCEATGKIQGIVCGACNGLGWIVAPAT